MYPFQLPPLPYAYDALEPFVDTETMHLHHDKHFASYVEGLNKALAGCPRLQRLELSQLICAASRYPDSIRIPVLRNAGGVYNHGFYFSGLSPDSEQQPGGALKQAIKRDFGDYAAFRKAMTEAAKGVFGSGYAWLGCYGDRLCIFTTQNQETPLPKGIRPILNIDVWEHAYYIKYHNVRQEYLEAIFHVINWEEAGKRYDNRLIPSPL